MFEMLTPCLSLFVIPFYGSFHLGQLSYIRQECQMIVWPADPHVTLVFVQAAICAAAGASGIAKYVCSLSLDAPAVSQHMVFFLLTSCSCIYVSWDPAACMQGARSSASDPSFS